MYPFNFSMFDGFFFIFLFVSSLFRALKKGFNGLHVRVKVLFKFLWFFVCLFGFLFFFLYKQDKVRVIFKMMKRSYNESLALALNVHQ